MPWARRILAKLSSSRFLRGRSLPTRRRVVIALTLVVAAPFLVVGVMALFTPLPPELRESTAPSLRVLSRRGQLLREVRADDGARARPLPLAAFPPHVRQAVLAAEDRRFYSHLGVDPIAVCRAMIADVVHRRIVSGASTITMQLARTLRPHRRTAWGKLTEMALAVRIEASLSKDKILEEYLNRVVYGPNVRGYAAASQAYLATPPASLSVAEAALLAGLPRGPSLYAANKRPDLATRRRNRVLDRMADAGMIDAATLERARAEPLVVNLDKPSFGAPHFVRELVSGTLNATQAALADVLSRGGAREALAEIHTTIDPDLQRAAEGAVTHTLASLAEKHVTAAAVVVIDNPTGDVLAWVGSADFHDGAALGQNDGVIALRQPGSSLKPFVYAEAMSRLGFTPATLLPDVELHIPLPGGGDYTPHDYDTKLRGPTRLREALGNSLNVPAVYTIHQLGTAAVLDRLHAFGFASLTESAEHYGPALALGDGEVTLLELANAYAALARGGVYRPVRIVTQVVRSETHGEAATSPSFEPGAPTRVVDERIAAMLTDVLRDKTARMSAFGDQNVLELEVDVAAKTGTSKGYRDNVAVGYTRDVTVAVWAGNFDGSPMAEVSGITGAGPIFRAVMTAAGGDAAHARVSIAAPKTARTNVDARHRLALGPEEASQLGLVRTAVCALSGGIATSACPHSVYEWLPEGDADHAPPCAVHERVRIDVRNGLRAGPGCEASVTEERVFERWPPPYEAWAAASRRPLSPESSPACPIDAIGSGAAEDPAGVRIEYPFDGARFVIDPDRPATLQLLAIRVAPEDASLQIWVDGAPLPASRSWQLVAGSHTVTARRSSVEADPVHFTVR
jgi:penicillin-binding protein 1C